MELYLRPILPKIYPEYSYAIEREVERLMLLSLPALNKQQETEVQRLERALSDMSSRLSLAYTTSYSAPNEGDIDIRANELIYLLSVERNLKNKLRIAHAKDLGVDPASAFTLPNGTHYSVLSGKLKIRY